MVLSEQTKGAAVNGDNSSRELTAEEAAGQLGYHINHLYRLLADGTIRGRQFNRVWIIRQSEVDRVKNLQDEYGRIWKGQV